MKEHEERFTEGFNVTMKPYIKEYAILDFINEDKEVLHPKDYFWYVCYNDDYSKFTIKKKGKR